MKHIEGLYRCHWGSAPSCPSRLLNGNELISSNGGRIFIYNFLEAKYLVFPTIKSPLTIISLYLSPNKKILVATIKLIGEDAIDRAVALVYDVESIYSTPRNPKRIQYCPKSPMNADIFFKHISFSHDSFSMICCTNMDSVGILIYDPLKGELSRHILMQPILNCATFSSVDSSKICVTGMESTFQFFRVTKSVHAAPINGLSKRTGEYTCHCWVNESRVVSGTSDGGLVLVHGCETICIVDNIFGDSIAPRDNSPRRNLEGHVDSDLSLHSVNQIIIRDDTIFASSMANIFALYEIKNSFVTGSMSQLAEMVPLIRYRAMETLTIYNFEWKDSKSLTSYVAIVTGSSSIFTVNFRSVDFTKLLSIESGAVIDPGKTKQSYAIVECADLRSESLLFSYHNGSLSSLQLSSRTGFLMSSSYEDGSIQVREIHKPSGTPLIKESFLDRRDEVPFFVTLHPSGMYVATATEDFVREYAVTDNKFEPTKQINMKLAFASLNGSAFVNSTSPSIVKYSHGGHLLAVVVSKTVQIFHMFNLDYSNAESVGQPSRIMTVADQTAAITDFSFSHDDTFFVATSMDGSIYSWNVGQSGRSGEFMMKGSYASRIAINSPWKNRPVSILGCYDSSLDTCMFLNSRKSNTRRLASIISTSRAVSRLPTAKSVESLTDMVEASRNSSRNCLVYWKNSVTPNPEIIYLDTIVTSISLGWTELLNPVEIAVLGLIDGRILLTALPFPLQIIGTSMTSTVQTTYLDSTISPVNGSILGSAPSTAASSATSMSQNDFEPVKHISTVGSLMGSSNPPSRSVTFGGRGSATVSNFGSSNDFFVGTGGFVSIVESPASTAPGTPAEINHSSTASINSASSPMGNSNPTSTVPSFNQVQHGLREADCKTLSLHSGRVTQVVLAPSGLWVFTAGADGSVCMVALSHFAKDCYEIPEIVHAQENTLIVAERSQLSALRTRILEVDGLIEDTQKECDRSLFKLSEQKGIVIRDLETRMKREIQKRDQIIVHGREDYSKLSKMMKEEVEGLHKKYQSELSQLELVYEKKLAQESMYLERMKQAYDEFVIHARYNLTESQKEADKKIDSIEAQKLAALQDAEKQKKALLAYVEYVNKQHTLVLDELENQQTSERLKLKDEMAKTTKNFEESQKQSRTETVQLHVKTHRLRGEMALKEEESLKLRSDLDWAKDRIEKLESALQQATLDIRLKTEACEKWEFKAGDQQQQIQDLERIRKVLTSQLHSLRQEMGPKEEKLMQITEKLQEVDKEYNLSLQAITEKEGAIAKSGENLHLLQKQVRELRRQSNYKDGLLKRAAKIFEDYKAALREAQFHAVKRPLPTETIASNMSTRPNTGALTDRPITASSTIGSNLAPLLENDTNSVGDLKSMKSTKDKSKKSELVEIISRTEAMEHSLKGLDDLLKQFLKLDTIDHDLDEESKAAKDEQDRHMQHLHRSVSGLMANIEHTSQVAQTKVQNHLRDNQYLLQEINSLRHEIRALSLENQRLLASQDFNERKWKTQLQRATSLNNLPSNLPHPSTMSAFPFAESVSVSLASQNSTESLLQRMTSNIRDQNEAMKPDDHLNSIRGSQSTPHLNDTATSASTSFSNSNTNSNSNSRINNTSKALKSMTSGQTLPLKSSPDYHLQDFYRNIGEASSSTMGVSSATSNKKMTEAERKIQELVLQNEEAIRSSMCHSPMEDSPHSAAREILQAYQMSAASPDPLLQSSLNVVTDKKSVQKNPIVNSKRVLVKKDVASASIQLPNVFPSRETSLSAAATTSAMATLSSSSSTASLVKKRTNSNSSATSSTSNLSVASTHNPSAAAKDNFGISGNPMKK